MKKSNSRKESKAQKFQISIVHKLGPYRNAQDASAAKSNIKNKVGHATFSGLSKTSRGVSFDVKTVYVKSITGGVTTKHLTSYFKAQSPKARVTVKKL